APREDLTMAMNVGSAEGDEEEAISTINTTPLVDVMLVLLIIFLITVPVITRTIRLDLPRAVNAPTETQPENITLAIDANGRVFWNDLAMPNNDVLLERLKSAAVQKPQPEVHVRADKAVRYEYVGRVIVLAQRAGIVKVGFITEPDRGIRGMRAR
ncbi:MAG TPA: biopolymer transporter ExbD, partial [Longimicrobiales bacterium]|nr:biopolymer transporter ExbD [Longimicrobiales bacterium]